MGGECRPTPLIQNANWAKEVSEMDILDGINGVLGVTAYVLGTMAEKEEE